MRALWPRGGGYDHVTEKITHLSEAAAHHTRYSTHKCKCVAGKRVPLRPFGRGKRVKSVRFNHLRAALLAVAVAGLLAAAGLVVVLYAQPAEANYPGKPAKIAYSGFAGQDSEIYTIKPDGGGKVPLTDNSALDRYPAYSPNGKKIVYSGKDAPNGDLEIYTINAGGGGKKQLTDNSTNDEYPYYSPSGKRIAYSGVDTGPQNDSEIYTIKVGGGSRFNVTDNSSDDYYPDYAPNGMRIAYANNAGGDDEIYTIKPNGGGRQPVTDNSSDDYFPSYSPSGKKIAYENDGGPGTGTDEEIYTISPNGGGRLNVTDNGTGDYEPYWGSQ